MKVIDQVTEESPWIEKFCNLRKLKLGSFSEMTDVAAIKESFVQKVQTLLSLTGNTSLISSATGSYARPAAQSWKI
jgi:hypothetical protein